MKFSIAESWKKKLHPQLEKNYFINLSNFITSEYEEYQCFPKSEDIFAAFNFCNYEDVKVVIIGQDPYHNVNQANGLCFSVTDDVKHPPSLVNIFKEIATDLEVEYPQSGNLERWATQGVLLLNATLTVSATADATTDHITFDTNNSSITATTVSATDRERYPQDLSFNSDGTSVYIGGPTTDKIFAYEYFNEYII